MTNTTDMPDNSFQTLLFRGRLPLLIGTLLIFMAFYDRTFFIPENLINIVSYSSINGLLAIGMTLLMISREFDISVGSNLVLSGVIAVQVATRFGATAGFVAGIAAGVVMGLINGLLVAKANINSFIPLLAQWSSTRVSPSR